MCLVGECEEEIDTSSIDSIHRYNRGLEYLSIGNIGLAGYNLVFNIKDYSTFSWSRMIGSKKHVSREYNVKKPYTMLSYVIGSKEEQVLGLLHTQNISKTANFSLGYDKVKSTGFYLNQASNNDHIYGNLWLKSKKEKYKLSLNVDHERIFNEHNGGVLYDSLFEQDLLLNRNRELMEVNLSIASSTIKRTQLDLSQSFMFANTLDSLKKGNSHSLAFNMSASNNSRVFKDTLLNMDYYSQIFLDSNRTEDVVEFNLVNGEIGYKYILNRKNEMVFYPHYQMELIDFNQIAVDTSYMSQKVGVDFSLETQKLKVASKSSYYFSGYRKEDVNLGVDIFYNLLKNWRTDISFLYSSITPSVDMVQYAGNHYSWFNDFTKTDYVNGKVSLMSKKMKLFFQINYNDIFNPIFNDFSGVPQQIEDVSQVISLSAKKEFVLKKWKVNAKAVYQYQGGYTIYRLPDYYAALTIAYKVDAFKNNLHLFIGTDIVYYAPITTMGFNPVTGQYHLDDTRSTGNYPFVDFFLNARIKSVRFFAKVSHATSGLMGYSYYGAAGYPLKDRTLQFGLNWNFIN